MPLPYALRYQLAWNASLRSVVRRVLMRAMQLLDTRAHPQVWRTVTTCQPTVAWRVMQARTAILRTMHCGGDSLVQ